MNRLLQGMWGGRKTVVTGLAMFAADGWPEGGPHGANNPEQHFESLQSFQT